MSRKTRTLPGPLLSLAFVTKGMAIMHSTERLIKIVRVRMLRFLFLSRDSFLIQSKARAWFDVYLAGVSSRFS
jgi:hypothetical protein